ncbi:MAG: DUF839 domain-containing protein, partial [Ectothiorhodospiraceae bacterium]|nr:DUF839 domain-containing protein [Ectothiorhodospiraceae bacterium]
MLSKHFKSRGIVLFSSAAVLSMVVGLTACNDSDDKKAITSVEFTSTPAPSSNADLVRATTSSKVIVTYDDGSTEEFPLSYNTLFKNVDRVGSSANEAGRLYDYQGTPLVDPNGDPLIAETADANSLLEVGDKLFLVNHWEYDWILANGTGANKAPNWYSRAPMSMNLTNIAQDKDSGKLTATDQRPIDFSGVDGLWIPCFGSQSPWNTHLGSEEDYDLYFVKASGGYDTATSNGLKAMTELYFKNSRQANPYHYGYIPEVKVNSDGSTEVKKHYNMGRGTWEQT